jgi:quercetin dioxygenase-like cupin family protein
MTSWLAVALCAVLLAAPSDAKKKKKGKWKPKEAMVMATDQMAWKAVPKAKGVQINVLWGNPMRGSYGAYVKWAAGTEHPMHFHTRPSHVVMVSGTMTVTTDDGKTLELKPGQYGFMPGRKKHTAACKEECVYFAAQPGPFDMKMPKAKKKKKKKKAEEAKPEEKKE